MFSRDMALNPDEIKEIMEMANFIIIIATAPGVFLPGSISLSGGIRGIYSAPEASPKGEVPSGLGQFSTVLPLNSL